MHDQGEIFDCDEDKVWLELIKMSETKFKTILGQKQISLKTIKEKLTDIGKELDFSIKSLNTTETKSIEYKPGVINLDKKGFDTLKRNLDYAQKSNDDLIEKVNELLTPSGA
jgi:hypothetical protein